LWVAPSHIQQPENGIGAEFRSMRAASALLI
jgi:hypothetical protein